MRDISFELIDHTADVGIKSSGENLEEAFEEVAKGMFSIITEISKVKTAKKRTVRIEEDNHETLLVKFLSDLIYHHEVNNEIYSDFEVSIDRNDKIILEAECSGEEIDLDRHEMDTAVKAVSYHELEIDTSGEIKIILDI